MKKEGINIKLISLLLFFLLSLSVVVVWINIKVINLSYRLQDLKKELKTQKEIKEKLTVELSHLTSKKHLLELAKRYKLKVPDVNKVRTIQLK